MTLNVEDPQNATVRGGIASFNGGASDTFAAVSMRGRLGYTAFRRAFYELVESGQTGLWCAS